MLHSENIPSVCLGEHFHFLVLREHYHYSFVFPYAFGMMFKVYVLSIHALPAKKPMTLALLVPHSTVWARRMIKLSKCCTDRKVPVYWKFWFSGSVIYYLFTFIALWRGEGFPVFHWRLFLIGQLCGKLDQLCVIINIFELPLLIQVIVILISWLPRRPLDFSNVNFFQTVNVIIEKKKNKLTKWRAKALCSHSLR